MHRDIGATVSEAVWGQSAYQHHEALMAGKVSLNEFEFLRAPLRAQGCPAVDFCCVLLALHHFQPNS